MAHCPVHYPHSYHRNARLVCQRMSVHSEQKSHSFLRETAVANKLEDVDSNQLTPDPILVLFIVASIAGVWVLFTLLGYAAVRRSAAFVALVDLMFVGAFIAGVYLLRGVTDWDCDDPNEGDLFESLRVFGLPGVRSNSEYAEDVGKNCAMLKACFALGIMNIIFFFFTFVCSDLPRLT